MRRYARERNPVSLLLVSLLITCGSQEHLPLYGKHAVEKSFGSINRDESSITVRILGGYQPESEILIKDSSGTPNIVHTVLSPQLRSQLFKRVKPSRDECASLSKTVRVHSNNVAMPTDLINHLLASLNTLEPRGDECVRAESGECAQILDAVIYEVRIRGRATRITDTSATNFIK